MNAVFLRRVIAGGLMIRAPVVPDDDVSLSPDVVVFGIGGDHPFLQFRDQLVTLTLFDPDKADDLARIEVERFAAGFRMRANDRVVNRGPVLVLGVQQFRLPSPSAIGEGADHPVQPIPEPLRQSVVGRITVGE